MQKLTPRQAEILSFIKRCLEDHGFPPTRAEIAQELGFKSPNAAEEHLKALARKGAIEMTPGASRGIRIPGFEPHAANDDEGLPVFWASNGAPLLDDVIDSPSSASIEEPAAFSELSLSGLPGHCLTLLAPILRELSEEQDARWLTLIAPPASLTHEWLRRAGLNRERILLLQAKDNAAALALSCEALRLGRSHTVVSWLEPLSRAARKQLSRAAQLGQAQSLNIRLG